MKYSVKHNHRLPDFTRWMDDIFGELDRTVGGNEANSVPQVNISESDEQFEISLAAPGFQKGDFKLHQETNFLTVSVENEAKAEGEKPAERVIRREFNYQNFSRKFTLPKTVDKDAITASYDNGILKLVLPKKEEEKAKPARTIEIG